MVNQATTAVLQGFPDPHCCATCRNPAGVGMEVGGHALASAGAKDKPVRRSDKAQCDPRLMALRGPLVKLQASFKMAASCALLRATVFQSTIEQV